MKEKLALFNIDNVHDFDKLIGILLNFLFNEEPENRQTYDENNILNNNEAFVKVFELTKILEIEIKILFRIQNTMI